jgi:hypothetical protein
MKGVKWFRSRGKKYWALMGNFQLDCYCNGPYRWGGYITDGHTTRYTKEERRTIKQAKVDVERLLLELLKDRHDRCHAMMLRVGLDPEDGEG